MRHNKILILACVFLTIPAVAQTEGPSKAPTKKPEVSSNAPASARTTSFDPALLQPTELNAKAPDVYDVKFETTAGDFVVEVARAWAPIGADRFYNLVRHHFYDGAAFFRVLSNPPFMAQFGLSAYPEVSKVWARAGMRDDRVTQKNHRGYITYAMAGPNTRTTQVFINYGNNERLDADGFAPFGLVTMGMEVVDKLYGGYGEGAPSGRGPDQGEIGTRGRAYLEKMFPKLDTIKTATLVPAPSTPPVSK
jgi:peptidyl-prolyl cis-trans isomerase A (cyclophilin A)